MRYYGAYLLNLSHKQLDEYLEVDEAGKVKNDIDKFIEYAMQWNMNVYKGTPARVGLTEKLQNNRN